MKKRDNWNVDNRTSNMRNEKETEMQPRSLRKTIRQSAHHQVLVAVVVLNLRVLALLLLGLAVTVAVDAQTYGIQRPNYIRFLRATRLSRSRSSKKEENKKNIRSAPINFRSRYFHREMS